MPSDSASINPGKKPLTIEKLKSHNGLEQLSDQEAEEILQAVDRFCRLVVKVHSTIQQKGRKHDQ